MHEIWRRHSFSIAFLLILLGGIFLLGEPEAGLERLSGYTMGTSYQLQFTLPADGAMEELAGEVEQLLAGLDRDGFSTYAANSELSRFNAHPVGQPFLASAAMLELLALAREMHQLTAGAFDITVGPLVNLWGFGPEPGISAGTVPDAANLSLALTRVGQQYLQLTPERGEISKTRPIYLDLSAIAKGYAVDQLARLMERRGVEAYFLEVGGELKMKGLKPDGQSWIPAIEAPEAGAARIYTVLDSRGHSIALAGSGDYRNYFEVDGVRYSHEIDPRSGRPVSHELAAAFVIDESAARADALATALMVLGPAAGQRLAEQYDLAVFLIVRSGSGEFDDYVSPAFSPYLAAPRGADAP